MRVFRKLYRVYSKYIKRHHLLDTRSKDNGYVSGYIDKCELLLYSSFAIFKDFMEKEKPLEITDFSSSKEDLAIKKEFEVLYRWWTSGRKVDHDSYIDSRDKLDKIIQDNSLDTYDLIKEISSLNEELEEKDTEMLIRLMKVRRHMWT